VSSQSKKACKGRKAVVAESEDEGTMNNELAPRGKYNVLDEMLRVQKDTRVKTKKRAPIPADAEEMPEICLRCARVCMAIGGLAERVDQIASSVANIEAVSQPSSALF
jgi:hypothetical protein